MPRTNYANIDEYIEACDPQVQILLQELRTFIRKHAHDATEKISWSMPTFYLGGNLVHFTAHKKHIGFYPGPSGIENFTRDFEKAGYKYSKGAVQFPIDKPLPWELIERIVKLRVEENML